MTPTEIMLIRQGFDRIAPFARQMGVAFYERLFAIDPSLRRLFNIDIESQAGHLMAAVAMVVRSLDDLSPVLEQIQKLGRRHAAYGVLPAHFAMSGAPFLDTLADVLGDAFTADARAAWTRAYETLTGAMIAAMADAVPEAA
jgi:hemoglobin-like flavoprotein